MSNPVSGFLGNYNPFKELNTNLFLSWALVNFVALAAIAYSRKPTVVCGAIGSMVVSTFAANQLKAQDRSSDSIFGGAILGWGLSSLILGNAIGSYLEDLASNSLSQI